MNNEQFIQLSKELDIISVAVDEIPDQIGMEDVKHGQR